MRCVDGTVGIVTSRWPSWHTWHSLPFGPGIKKHLRGWFLSACRKFAGYCAVSYGARLIQSTICLNGQSGAVPTNGVLSSPTIETVDVPLQVLNIYGCSTKRSIPLRFIASFRLITLEEVSKLSREFIDVGIPARRAVEIASTHRSGIPHGRTMAALENSARSLALNSPNSTTCCPSVRNCLDTLASTQLPAESKHGACVLTTMPSGVGHPRNACTVERIAASVASPACGACDATMQLTARPSR